MRKQIFTLGLSTFFGLGAAIAAPQAQDQSAPQQTNQTPERHQPDPNRQIQMLTKRLNLSADQQNQILPVLTSRQQQMQSVRADASLSAQERGEKMRAVREDSDSKIRAILTDDQKKTYDQMQQQMRDRMRQHSQERQQNATPDTK
ncbi:MAG: hypothetical protein WB992_20720 [Bryobacteraceae bacterium]